MTDDQRFQIQAHTFRDQHSITLTCTQCSTWTAILDSPLTLAELVRRADQHTEDCR